MNNIIEVKNMSKYLKNFALEDINFSIPEGYILGLIGPNGAGKTTLIKNLLGLMIPDNGEIRLFGENFSENQIKIKKRIGFVLENHAFNENISARVNKEIIAQFYPSWDNDYYNDLLKKFKLNDKILIKKFSKGMKKNFAITLALSHRPDFLILDEPTSGLDPSMRELFKDILQDYISDSKRSVLFSTHITSDLENIADYICMLQSGKIKLFDNKETIIEDHILINGRKSELQNFEKHLISFKTNQFNFTGLIKKKDYQPFGNTISEIPNLHDLMIYYSEGVSNV